ncbi:MAG: T9SS type A sorting domain-containing protein, partial [Bacteroidales bacterium]|nr:T9SS type A sorting domain-containing protein [Bacteroidales bacterium]
KYNDSWSGQGFHMVSAESSNVRVIHSVNSFSFNAANINGEEMTVINMPGIMLPNDEGAPNLPGEGRYIAMPVGASAKLNIISMRVETYNNIEVAPSPRIPFENDDSPLFYERNMEIYGENAFYPADPIKISEPTQIRGVDVVILGITPFQYNPVTKELKVLRDIEVEVVFEGGNGQYGDPKYRSRWWDPIMADVIMNFKSLPVIDYNWMHMNGPSENGECEYLIITPDGADYVAWADSIALFRNKQGILTEVYTLTEVGGNTTSAIESFVNNAYNTWTIPPSAALLLGDYGTNISNNVIAPIYNNYCASDNIYADVNGDHLPEIAFARITANNADQVETMVSKFINYETNPPTNPDFYNNPITAIGYQSTRWFQICGETVGGFWKNELGKSPVRINDIYSGTPGSSWSSATNTSTVVNYFGPNGLGYIPATPAELGGWTGGTATMINNTVNNGSFMLLHRDHGGLTGWGEPSYHNSDINGLQNSDLIYVMSINCLTGKYNWSGECFAEKFHRHTYNGANAGALGITAASDISYSFVNDTYVWGFIDNMWPAFMPDYGTQFPQNFALPAFGNASGKYFLQQSSWPYNTGSKLVTYHLFHHHGGAFLTVYYEEPMNLTIIHDGSIDFGAPTFEITADNGSLISLYYDGAILATATGTGSVQSISIPAIPLDAIVTLTVTKQNYFRHEEPLPVEDPLTAMFYANMTLSCMGGVINFTDLSVGNPTSWLWTFDGGSPASSTEQNPQGILYSGLGDFDVSLEVTNIYSTNTCTITDYISIVDEIEVVATIYASVMEICETEEVIFTAEVENGGYTPAYQWKLNGTNVGDSTDTYATTILVEDDIVECELTSSFYCATPNPVMSNAIMVTVYPSYPVSVSIETDTTVICEGTTVLFNAFPVNGGSNPFFQWKINGENSGPNLSGFVPSDLEDGDVITCEVTSDLFCALNNPALSNEITMTVLDELNAGIGIESSAEEICENDEVTFTATAVNGGTEPAFQWKVNDENVGDNSDTYITTELVEGDDVCCELTSSYPCLINNPVTSNHIFMTVNPYPEVLAKPFGPGYVDLMSTQTSSYTTTADTSLAYTWTVSPESAWEELTVDMHNLTVTWSLAYMGLAVINVYGTNDCGDGPISEDKEVTIDNTTMIGESDLNIGLAVFPNPNNGSFTVKLTSAGNENVKLEIRSIVGESVFSEELLTVDGELVKTFDLSNYAEGIYFLILENNNKVLTEKIVVQK